MWSYECSEIIYWSYVFFCMSSHQNFEDQITDLWTKIHIQRRKTSHHQNYLSVTPLRISLCFMLLPFTKDRNHTQKRVLPTNFMDINMLDFFALILQHWHLICIEDVGAHKYKLCKLCIEWQIIYYFYWGQQVVQCNEWCKRCQWQFLCFIKCSN